MEKHPLRTKDLKTKEKEIAVLRMLRQDSRTKTAKVAEKMKLHPLSAAALLKRINSSYVMKCCSIIDFEKLGYPISSFFIIRPSGKKNDTQEGLKGFLKESHNINTVSRTRDGSFMAEAYFSSMADLVSFRHTLEDFAEVEEHEIISSVEKEKFMC
ncbi:MAG: Lrp/AsnC family transcriptional regulator [Candidatus Woesearchaeota archaeon]